MACSRGRILQDKTETTSKIFITRQILEDFWFSIKSYVYELSDVNITINQFSRKCVLYEL